MKIIRPVLLHIALILFLSFTPFIHTSLGNKPQSENEKPLRQLLEDTRIYYGINYIYADNLIEDISIKTSNSTALTHEELEEKIKNYNLAFRSFDANTFVLFKIEKQKETSHERVITAQEVSETDSVGLRIKPILISSPQPPYPREAVKKEIEGSVRIKFLVNELGNVSQSEVLATSGYAILDSAAKEFVFTLKYSPGEKNGKPRSTWMSMLFRYVLDE